MDDIIVSPTNRAADIRQRMAWARKTISKRKSTIFSKVSHSEEWHQNVAATAGALHPSDARFPWGFLRNHTDVYLKKKGKISQADTDMRLATLIQAHPARDIAVASAAHAVTSKCLRGLLRVECNVAEGSYWGLDTWLQSLIAANDGNPACLTDLEAQWARELLPYATHGANAAGLYVKGIGRVLRKSNIPDMCIVPEFESLLWTAISDYAAQLDRFRLKCQWIAAREAVFWMLELDMSLPGRPPEVLHIEHILNTRFRAWRIWANWSPNSNRLLRYANIDGARFSTILDVAKLEGPDVRTGRETTSRRGWVAQYEEKSRWTQYRGLSVEVPDCTKGTLATILERLSQGLDTVSASRPGSDSLFELFRELTISQKITLHGLNLFEAAVKVSHTPENDCYNTIREVWVGRDKLSGSHVLPLQRLLYILNGPGSTDLRSIIVEDWLLRGIETCFQHCQSVIRKQIEGPYWIYLLLELYAFATAVKACEHLFALLPHKFRDQMRAWPGTDQMNWMAEIYNAAQAHRLKEHRSRNSFVWVDPDTSPELLFALATPDEKKMRHPLETIIEQYCLGRLLGVGTMTDATRRALGEILHVWSATNGLPTYNARRALAILISAYMGDHETFECRCISEIAPRHFPLVPPTFAKCLRDIVAQADKEPLEAIVALTKLLAKKDGCTRCWKALLYRWLEKVDKNSRACHSFSLLNYTLDTMKTAEWFSFMRSLDGLFCDPSYKEHETSTKPLILHSTLSRWVSALSRFSGTLARLEDSLGNRNTVRRILVCGERILRQHLVEALTCLRSAEGKLAEPIMQKIMGWVADRSINAWNVKDCLANLLDATPQTIEACETIWDAKHGFLDIPGLPTQDQAELCQIIGKQDVYYEGENKLHKTTPQPDSSNGKMAQYALSAQKPIAKRRYDVPLAVTECMVAGWIQNDIDLKMTAAFVSLARLLNLEIYSDTIPLDELAKATAFWEIIEEEIVKEAERHDTLRRALKAKDPIGIARLLEVHNIPDTSLLEEEIVKLPAGIIDHVELVGENDVELSFSLSSYTELQRNAMGVPQAAKYLIIHFSIDHYGVMPPSFCTHFDSDPGLDTLEHLPWICSKGARAPHEHVCVSPQTAFIWQMNRGIYRLLHTGVVAIGEIYRLVQTKIGRMGHGCVSCALPHNAKNARLRRSTPCGIIACAQLWYQLPLEVRIPEIRTDIFAVDIMLSSVYAAAWTGNAELLPGCPFGQQMLKEIFKALPPLKLLEDVKGISRYLQAYHKDAENLISWACVQFRGYIATATGLCKIKNLPKGTHQFILANASPKLESQYVSRLPTPSSQTTVLFHGTSLDRLPAILAQGLLIYSGTSLQSTGAVYGNGIYMAEDPSTSFHYAPTSLSWKNSGLSNMKLILGCEVVGAGGVVNANSGVHVIKDEGSVMVRYLFLFPLGAAMPVRNHVVTPMASAMNALRTGVM